MRHRILLAAGLTALVAPGVTSTFERMAVASARAADSAVGTPQAANLDFPDGTATSSEACGACHRAIYREFAEGFGSDLRWREMKGFPQSASALQLPRGTSRSATAHAVAGVDPFPAEAIQVQENGRQCIVCHYPEPLQFPDMNAARIEKPKPRLVNHDAGITCASCHLTPDGSIRGPYGVKAPHKTVKDERIQTSVACAFCHADGERVVGKQTQTFLEWREDFNKPGLGPQHCQDCHMPRTIRKLAEDADVPERSSARHLWTGGHSYQRTRSALTLAVRQAAGGQSKLGIHVINTGAGHSVPTGSNRRAVYLKADVIDGTGQTVATQEWMFAPWYANRPDDRAFLDGRETTPSAAAADAQGPHETIIRAGEDRELSWSPELAPGRYEARIVVTYDLNRYNDRGFGADQHEIARASAAMRIDPSR